MAQIDPAAQAATIAEKLSTLAKGIDEARSSGVSLLADLKSELQTMLEVTNTIDNSIGDDEGQDTSEAAWRTDEGEALADALADYIGEEGSPDVFDFVIATQTEELENAYAVVLQVLSEIQKRAEALAERAENPPEDVDDEEEEEDDEEEDEVTP